MNDKTNKLVLMCIEMIKVNKKNLEVLLQLDWYEYG